MMMLSNLVQSNLNLHYLMLALHGCNVIVAVAAGTAIGIVADPIQNTFEAASEQYLIEFDIEFVEPGQLVVVLEDFVFSHYHLLFLNIEIFFKNFNMYCFSFFVPQKSLNCD